jgi:hypothetical protein
MKVRTTTTTTMMMMMQSRDRDMKGRKEGRAIGLVIRKYGKLGGVDGRVADEFRP